MSLSCLYSALKDSLVCETGENASRTTSSKLVALYLMMYETVLELDNDTLRDAAQEILELAELYGPTPDETDRQRASFNGWIAGILLGTLLGNLRDLPVELQWLPSLLQIFKLQPQFEHLRELLSLETDKSEQRKAVPALVDQANRRPLPPRLTIRAFGEPVVLIDSQPIKHWRMAKAMELFFFLLDASQPLSREQIITELWQDGNEQTNQTFYSTLHQLRKLFGAPALPLQANGYALNLTICYGESIWYDAQIFQMQNERAKRALKGANYSTARAALLQMVELYRGDYGRPFDNRWCSLRRDKLRATYMDARRHLARMAWREGELEECIEHWRSLLQIDNCLEEAHLGLMQCYLRQGKRSAALRQYQQCKETLREELGTRPDPSLQQFYRSLVTPQAGQL